jgi:nucleotide sugar dehydrogenase
MDISSSLVAGLRAGTHRSDEPGVAEGLTRSAEWLRPIERLTEAVAAAETVFVCVDTPSTGGEQHYDHTKLGCVLTQLGAIQVGPRPLHVVICCTVLPGYMDEVAADLLQGCGRPWTLIYNPLFIAQGAILEGLRYPDLVLVGQQDSNAGRAAGARLGQLWGRVVGKEVAATCVRRMGMLSAEVAKLGLNCFVTAKIAFANFIGDVCEAAPRVLRGSGAVPDAAVVLAAIGLDRRVGMAALRPGYGFGGPCFPRDNRALGRFSRRVGVEPVLPSATDAANNAHAEHQAAALLRDPVPTRPLRGLSHCAQVG